MRFDFVTHGDCPSSLRQEISRLKMQSWQYPVEAQLAWMEDNLVDNDIHLLLRDNAGVLVGYLDMVHLKVEADNANKEMLGVGNVCVDMNARGCGYGFLLVKLAESRMRSMHLSGVLLCHDALVGFYSLCGWHKFGGELVVAGEKLACHCFTNSALTGTERLTIDRNF